MKSRFYSGRWLQRLGVVATEQPEIVGVISPMILVGDHTGVFPPVPAPSAFIGVFRTAVILEFGTVEFHARAVGGMWIRNLVVSVASLAFPNVPIGMTLSTSSVSRLTGGAAVVKVPRFGTTVSSASSNSEPAVVPAPVADVVVTTHRVFPDFFLSSGRFLQVQGAVSNDLYVEAVIDDVVAPLPDPQ